MFLYLVLNPFDPQFSEHLLQSPKLLQTQSVTWQQGIMLQLRRLVLLPLQLAPPHDASRTGVFGCGLNITSTDFA